MKRFIQTFTYMCVLAGLFSAVAPPPAEAAVGMVSRPGCHGTTEYYAIMVDGQLVLIYVTNEDD